MRTPWCARPSPSCGFPHPGFQGNKGKGGVGRGAGNPHLTPPPATQNGAVNWVTTPFLFMFPDSPTTLEVAATRCHAASSPFFIHSIFFSVIPISIIRPPSGPGPPPAAPVRRTRPPPHYPPPWGPRSRHRTHGRKEFECLERSALLTSIDSSNRSLASNRAMLVGRCIFFFNEPPKIKFYFLFQGKRDVKQMKQKSQPNSAPSLMGQRFRDLMMNWG